MRKLRLNSSTTTMQVDTGPAPRSIAVYATGSLSIGSLASGLLILTGHWSPDVAAAFSLLGGGVWLAGQTVVETVLSVRADNQAHRWTELRLSARPDPVVEREARWAWSGHTGRRIEPEAIEAIDFLRASERTGLPADQIASKERLSLSRDRWETLVGTLRPFVVTNPPGRVRGTYVCKPYDTSANLRRAIERGILVPSPEGAFLRGDPPTLSTREPHD